MQLFVRALQTHALEVTGQETVFDVKVSIRLCQTGQVLLRIYLFILRDLSFSSAD